MSILNLDALFEPTSIALVGGTEDPASVGGVLTRNLLAGGHPGPIHVVNRKRDTVLGRPAFRSVADLPEPPDLGVVAIPAAGVPGVLRELGAAGARAAVVISAGFAELGTEEGRARRDAMLEAAGETGLRVLGPNGLGMIAPHAGLNASFAHLPPRPGQLAFVSQSGAILTAMLDWAESREIGFSAMVSLGNADDVDPGDILDYLALDPQTSAILLYLEGLRGARKFVSAARAAARSKPVIVVKSGRHESGAKAAASHTAALAGADDVFDAAFRRAGILRVTTLEGLFEAAEVLSMARPPRGRRVAILTNGGGAGVMAADALLDEGAEVAELAPATVEALDGVLPATWSRRNPVDIIGDASPERYAAALAPLARDPGVDVILAMNCPTALASSLGAAEAVAEAAPGPEGPVLVTSWIGEHDAAKAREHLAHRRIPSYAMPEAAVRAVMVLDRYRRLQETLLQTPERGAGIEAPDRAKAEAIVKGALAEGREWLDEVEGKALLEAWGIPTVPSFREATPEAAGARAQAIGKPVALKLLSPDVVHKSEAGAVLLDVAPRDAASVAASALERIARTHPGARITGISVQPMVDRSAGWELFAGISTDPLFGPVVLFGEGGVAVEVIRDRAIGLPPLTLPLADRLVARTRVDRRLRGFRHRPPVDREALCTLLVRIAQLAAEMADVVELDVNPLVASAEGVVALDARVRVQAAEGDPGDRLTIRPYPSEQAGTVVARDGRAFPIRPLRPEDAPALAALFGRLTPEQLRHAFRGAPASRAGDEKSAPGAGGTEPQDGAARGTPASPARGGDGGDRIDPRVARLVQLDFDREMVWGLLEPDTDRLEGILRVRIHPDRMRAEYTVLVADEVAGRGLGTALVRHALAYARTRRLREVVGRVLPDNETMLDLARRLGFRETRDPREPGLVRVTMALGEEGGAGEGGA